MELRIKESDKVENGNLKSSFNNARYDNVSGIGNDIPKIVQIATRLKELNVPLPDIFLVHYALNYLRMEFEQLRFGTMRKGKVRY